MSAVSNSVAPGHVFLLHGDVTNIACDVWLLPTNRNFKVEDFWKFDGNRKPEPPPGWGKGGVRVAKAKVPFGSGLQQRSNVGV